MELNKTTSRITFLSTLSLRRATYTKPTKQVKVFISIHALLAESDIVDTLILADTMLFLSTLSLRRATSAPRITPTASRNFYPRSPCGERPTKPHQEQQAQHISIHALLAESDERADSLAHAPPEISIHALLAESDHETAPYRAWENQFLSTLSLRRATPLR